MRAVLIISALLALGGCADNLNPSQPTTGLGDVASYDAINQATRACEASGGVLERRARAGGDRVSDYACRPQPRQGGQ
jgi:hypothetical protein